jgi:predicted negative regulator of RcsB-dependent stress response
VDELSEQEQWERLKGWVRTNGPQVLVMVAVMLLGWYGWKWWQARGLERATSENDTYQAILVAFDNEKSAEALALIETLRSDHPKSPYVAAADMVASRVFVEANQLDKAAERLQRVATSAEDVKLRPVAQIRLARVQSAQGKYDEALATLGDKPMGPQEPARLEARGDILLAKGDRAAALAAYGEAIKLQPVVETSDGQGDARELLDLKIADLKGGGTAAPAASPAPAAAPAPTPDNAAKPPAVKPCDRPARCAWCWRWPWR